MPSQAMNILAMIKMTGKFNYDRGLVANQIGVGHFRLEAVILVSTPITM